MLKHLLTFSFIAISASLGFAQDVITKKTGEGIKSKVLEITPSEIKYKLFENLEGPTYTLAKADVLLVKYENNTEEIFTGTESFKQGVEIVDVKGESQRLYEQGKQDAKKHYKGYKGAGTATLVTTLLLSPLFGLAPAIATSSVKPQDQNLNYPNHELMKNADYSTGYKNEARRTKNRKVWTNWGIGFGVILAYVLVNAQ